MNDKPHRRLIANFGVSWESAYGYAQAVRHDGVISLSRQLSHDRDGTLVSPAALNASGKPLDFSMMEAQMRKTYKNASELLAEFGATLADVVEGTLYVLDVPTAFTAACKVRKELYGCEQPRVASNLIGVSQLAFPEQLIEIAFRAVPRSPHTTV